MQQIAQVTKHGSIITKTCPKQQSMEWKQPSSPETKNSKSQASTGELMLLLFWDCNDLILEYYLGQGTTVPAASYSEILTLKLKPLSHNRHRVLLSKGFIFLYNEAHPYSAAAIVEDIRQLKFELLPHPPPSLALAPLDYHMSGPQKKNSIACASRFASVDEVMKFGM